MKMLIFKHASLITIMVVQSSPPIRWSTCFVPMMNYCNSKDKNGSVHYIPLNKNGISFDSTNLSMCKSGQKIDLISYEFQNNVTKEEFSAAEELELYQMCSFRESCTNMQFPSRSDQHTNYTYNASIRFQCIDTKRSNIMNLCDNSHMSFKDTLHLIYNESAILSTTRCECWINGLFSVTLNDLRLGVKQLNECSSASLRIKTEWFKCKENIPNLGSIFQRKILLNPQFVYILLNLQSTRSPTMVWLKIDPTDESNVTCSRTPSSFTTIKITSANDYYIPNSTYTSDSFTDLHADEQEGTSPPTNIKPLVIIISVVCVVCLLLVIAFMAVGWYLYTRLKKKEKRVDIPREEQENRTPANNAIESSVPHNMQSPEYLPADNGLRESLYDKLQTNSCYYSDARASASNFQNAIFEDEYDNAQLRNTRNTRDSNYDHVPFVNAKL